MLIKCTRYEAKIQRIYAYTSGFLTTGAGCCFKKVALSEKDGREWVFNAWSWGMNSAFVICPSGTVGR